VVFAAALYGSLLFLFTRTFLKLPRPLVLLPFADGLIRVAVIAGIGHAFLATPVRADVRIHRSAQAETCKGPMRQERPRLQVSHLSSSHQPILVDVTDSVVGTTQTYTNNDVAWRLTRRPDALTPVPCDVTVSG